MLLCFGSGIFLNIAIANAEDSFKENVFAVLMRDACIYTDYSDKCIERGDVINFYTTVDGILERSNDELPETMSNSDFICKKNGSDRVYIPKNKEVKVIWTDDFSVISKKSKYNNIKNWKECN